MARSAGSLSPRWWLVAALSMACTPSDELRQPGFPDGDRLPLTYRFASDEHLEVQAASGSWFRAEFGGWGSHLDPHTGHAEGDPKVTWEVPIRPPGAMVEMVGDWRNAGNGDGICDDGELCGVSAATAMAHDIWLHNPYEALEIIGIHVHPQSEGYIEETHQWTFDTLIPGHTAGIAPGHLGALSTELLGLLEQRLGAEGMAALMSSGSAVFNEDPLLVPHGTPLARAQRGHSGMVEVDGSMVYRASARFEWFHVADESPDCMFLHYLEPSMGELQQAMDAALAAPLWGGKFDPHFEGSSSVYAGGQGRVCNSDHLDHMGYDTLSSHNARSWTRIDDPREVLAVVPIHTDTGGYDIVAEHLHPDGGAFLFRWALFDDDVATQDLGQAFELRDVQGEVLGLDDPTAPSGSFVLWAPVDHLVTGWASVAIGVTYHMHEDQLVLHFGDVVETVETVVMPPAVGADLLCDGDRVRCYSRDFLGLAYPDE